MAIIVPLQILLKNLLWPNLLCFTQDARICFQTYVMILRQQNTNARFPSPRGKTWHWSRSSFRNKKLMDIVVILLAIRFSFFWNWNISTLDWRISHHRYVEFAWFLKKSIFTCSISVSHNWGCTSIRMTTI